MYLMICGTAGTGGKEASSISKLLPICLTWSVCYIRGFTSPRRTYRVNFQTAHPSYPILPKGKQTVEIQIPRKTIICLRLQVWQDIWDDCAFVEWKLDVRWIIKITSTVYHSLRHQSHHYGWQRSRATQFPQYRRTLSLEISYTYPPDDSEGHESLNPLP